MIGRHALAEVASLVGDPSRAAMLLALLGGHALPAGELARVAGLSAPAASLHLGKLVHGGLLAVRRDGRHRYYRLAHGGVAHALETLGVLGTHPPPPRSASPGRPALRAARTCYDHLAGVLAVELADFMERHAVLEVVDDRRYEITDAGSAWLAETLQIERHALARARRVTARRCLDWTERRPHVAGALGAAMLERFLTLRWVARTRDPRALRITARGELAFERFRRRSAV